MVSQYFHPENFRVNELVTGLLARGHKVTVLTGQPNYPDGRFFPGYGWCGPRRELLLGADVVRVPLVARGGGGTVRLALNYLSFAVSASLGVLFRLSGTFDVIFVFEPSPITVGVPAAVARRRFRAPILFWVLDLWPDSLAAAGAIRSPIILRTVGKLVRWVYGHCDRVLVQSRAFVDNVVAHGAPAAGVRYFPNWIESDYTGHAVGGGSGGPARIEGEFRIVYAGNIGAAQDFPTILDAAQRLAGSATQVRWIVAGDGRMASWVKDEVERRGLDERFTFLGQLPSAAMSAIFADADALLVALRPDPVFSLTIPGKVQSYLSAGKPVLAMLDGEGARVIMESGGGLASAAGDAAGLVASVVRLLGMTPDQRVAMGQCGRDFARQEFGREALFDRLEAWIRESVAEWSHRNQL